MQVQFPFSRFASARARKCCEDSSETCYDVAMALSNRRKAELEMKMLRSSRGESKMDRIRND